MKFPTTTPMFPPVALSPTECARYEQLANALVGDTLTEYDLYNDVQQRHVSKKLWKTVKSRENLTVYKDRNYDPDNNVHRGLASGIAISSGDEMAQPQSSSRSSSLPASILESIPAEEWNLPKLLMVGTVSGTLDDVMYGLVAPDPGLMLLKAQYTQDEVIDAQILAQIHGLSPQEPYKFLGIKWLVKGNPAAVSALVLPRDLILLESTGVLPHPTTGERIGYFLMHSVNIPTCAELPTKGAVRARLSTCYIFKELANGVVDVYMKCFVELNGKINDTVAIISAANGLLCCWKAVVCAQSKKLVWKLKTRLRENKRRIGGGSSASASSLVSQDDFQPQQQQQKQLAPNCGMCNKSFKMYSRVACCQLCDGAMCSRCRVTMKLASPRLGEKNVRLKSVVVCKRCIASSNQQNTFEIAQQEVLSGRYGSLYSGPSSGYPGSRTSATSTTSMRAANDAVDSNNRATVDTHANSEDVDGNSILMAQAQAYAQSSVSGTGGTILHAHAQDRKKARAVSEGAAYLSSLSVNSSVADTTRSTDFTSYYSESGGLESPEDLSEDDDDVFATIEPLAADADGVITSDWSTVSPTARQQYLDSVQGRTPEEQAMWKRMAQLHLQAESLYQFTKKNTETLFHGNPVSGVPSTRGTEVLMPTAAPALQDSLSHRMSID